MAVSPEEDRFGFTRDGLLKVIDRPLGRTEHNLTRTIHDLATGGVLLSLRRPGGFVLPLSQLA
jgi:hypothetical protein